MRGEGSKHRHRDPRSPIQWGKEPIFNRLVRTNAGAIIQVNAVLIAAVCIGEKGLLR